MSGICTFALLRARHARLLVVAVAFAFSRDPVPEMLITDATVPGYSGIRFWGDDPSAVTPEMVQEFFAQKAAAIAAEPSLKRNTAYGLTIPEAAAMAPLVLACWQDGRHMAIDPLSMWSRNQHRIVDRTIRIPRFGL